MFGNRSIRIAVAAVVAMLATTSPAVAAKRKPKPPPPICNLIKDAANDAGLMGNTAQPVYDPSLDIRSVDIGVSATMLTAVIRVTDLTKESNAAPTGRMWDISMSNGTATLGLSAYLSPVGKEQFSSGKGIFDWNADQIRIHAPLAEYPNAKIKRGAMLRGFYITSNQVVGFDPTWSAGYAFVPFSTPADKTDPTTAAFPVGAASCVRVGV